MHWTHDMSLVKEPIRLSQWQVWTAADVLALLKPTRQISPQNRVQL